jgi:hypothetical protein
VRMSATKTVGFVVLIGVGIYAVYYFMNKKIEAAESEAGKKIEDLAANLKGGVAGVLGTAATALKGLFAGSKAGSAASGAAAAASFVGPIKPASAALGMGTEAGAGALSGMTAAGATAGAAVVALWLYTAFKKLFPSKDPEWEAIERKLQEARTAGKPIISQVTKASLKAPVR